MAFPAAQAFMKAVKTRRSVYTITDTNLSMSDSQIETIVRQALVDCPSPWNVSSSRAIIVLGERFKNLFLNVIGPVVREAASAADRAHVENRLQGHAAGYGSVLFFEDGSAVESLKESRPFAAPIIPEYSDVSSGMLQFTVWTAFSAAGLGCSLQHLTFRPGVEAAIRQELQIPGSWIPKAQLVFGRPTKEVGERLWASSAEIDDRVKIVV